jgi:hypothetical protein
MTDDAPIGVAKAEISFSAPQPSTPDTPPAGSARTA